MLNPAGGLRLYDSSFKRKYALAVVVEEECHQQFASLKGGSFLAVAGAKGLVQIIHSQDASIALKLKVPDCRKPFINAIHIRSGSVLLFPLLVLIKLNQTGFFEQRRS